MDGKKKVKCQGKEQVLLAAIKLINCREPCSHIPDRTRHIKSRNNFKD